MAKCSKRENFWNYGISPGSTSKFGMFWFDPTLLLWQRFQSRWCKTNSSGIIPKLLVKGLWPLHPLAHLKFTKIECVFLTSSRWWWKTFPCLTEYIIVIEAYDWHSGNKTKEKQNHLQKKRSYMSVWWPYIYCTSQITEHLIFEAWNLSFEVES